MKLSILRAETKSIVKVSFYGVVIKIMLPDCLHIKNPLGRAYGKRASRLSPLRAECTASNTSTAPRRTAAYFLTSI